MGGRGKAGPSGSNSGGSRDTISFSRSGAHATIPKCSSATGKEPEAYTDCHDKFVLLNGFDGSIRLATVVVASGSS